MKKLFWIYMVLVVAIAAGCGPSVQTFPVAFTQPAELQQVNGLKKWSISTMGQNKTISHQLNDAINSLTIWNERYGSSNIGSKEKNHITLYESDLKAQLLSGKGHSKEICEQKDANGTCTKKKMIMVWCDSRQYSMTVDLQIEKGNEKIHEEQVQESETVKYCSDKGKRKENSYYIAKQQKKLVQKLIKKILPSEKTTYLPVFITLGVQNADPTAEQNFAAVGDLIKKKSHRQATALIKKIPASYLQTSWALNYNQGLLLEMEGKKGESLSFYQKALTLLGPTPEKTIERSIENNIKSRIRAAQGY